MVRLRCWWRFRAHGLRDPVALANKLPEICEASWTDFHFKPQSSWLDVQGVDVLPMVTGIRAIESQTGVAVPKLNASVCQDDPHGDWRTPVKAFYAEDYEL